MKFDLIEMPDTSGTVLPKIKVFGLGGGGGNAVDYMVSHAIEGVDFFVANTDAQALSHNKAPNKMQLGKNGLGAGGKPERGQQAAMENVDEIKEMIGDADMVFITAGMGGGTGTGSAPVVASVAKELGVLTVGVVTRPFSFENRNDSADAGLKALSEQVDSLIVIPNDKLIKVLGRDFVFAKAFEYANDVLYKAVKGVSEVVTRHGMINVDFEDVRSVMSRRGMAMMGIGTAKGEDKARKAALDAISNPLLDELNVSNAGGLLVNITSGMDFNIGEFEDVGQVIRDIAAPDCQVYIGQSFDLELQDEIRVTIVATGLTAAQTQQVAAKNQTAEKPAAVSKPASNATGRLVRPAAEAPVAASGNTATRPQAARLVVNGGRLPNFEDRDYLDIPAFIRRQAD